MGVGRRVLGVRLFFLYSKRHGVLLSCLGKGVALGLLWSLVLVKSHGLSAYSVGSWRWWVNVWDIFEAGKHALWGFPRIEGNPFRFWQCTSTSGSEGWLLRFQFGCPFGGGSGVKPDPFWRVEEFAFEVSLLRKWAILSVCFCAFTKASAQFGGVVVCW